MSAGLSAGRPSARTATTGARVDSILAGEELARVNFEIPKAKREALRVYALQRGTTVKDLLTAHIDELLRGAK